MAFVIAGYVIFKSLFRKDLSCVLSSMICLFWLDSIVLQLTISTSNILASGIPSSAVPPPGTTKNKIKNTNEVTSDQVLAWMRRAEAQMSQKAMLATIQETKEFDMTKYVKNTTVNSDIPSWGTYKLFCAYNMKFVFIIS